MQNAKNDSDILFRNKWLSLIIFTVENTLLILYSKYLVQSNEENDLSDVSVLAVQYTELLKIGVSLILCFWLDCNFDISQLLLVLRRVVSIETDFGRLVIPSFLYLIQNNLQYFIDANPVYQVMYQLKILTSAWFYWRMASQMLHPAPNIMDWTPGCLSWLLPPLDAQRMNQYDGLCDSNYRNIIGSYKMLTRGEWFCIFMLALGVGMVQISQVSLQTEHLLPTFGMLAVFGAVFASGYAGSHLEQVIKCSKSSVWVLNIQLSVLSYLFSGILANSLQYANGSVGIQDVPIMSSFTNSSSSFYQFYNNSLTTLQMTFGDVFGSYSGGVLEDLSNHSLRGFQFDGIKAKDMMEYVQAFEKTHLNVTSSLLLGNIAADESHEEFPLVSTSNTVMNWLRDIQQAVSGTFDTSNPDDAKTSEVYEGNNDIVSSRGFNTSDVLETFSKEESFTGGNRRLNEHKIANIIMLQEEMRGRDKEGLNIVIFLQAVNGILNSQVIRFSDTIHKLFAVSVSIVIAHCCHYLLSLFWPDSFVMSDPAVPILPVDGEQDTVSYPPNISLYMGTLLIFLSTTVFIILTNKTQALNTAPAVQYKSIVRVDRSKLVANEKSKRSFVDLLSST